MSAQPIAASTTGPDIVTAFGECWTSWRELGRTLDEDAWASPALCPGWTCKDALIHLTAAETGFADWTPSPTPPMEQIGVAIKSLRQRSGAEVLTAFEAITGRRSEQLATMGEDGLDAVGWSPAGIGPYRRYMEIRIFDTWAHEQDVRVPLGMPGHLEGRGPLVSLNEAHIAFGYLVGKRAGLPDGSSVTVHVTGPNARDLHAVIEGRARVVDELSNPACELTVDFATFMLLCCGRIDPEAPLGDGRVVLGGDRTLAEAVARNLAFTI
ncbi:MAG: maleylpyruvate isomerase family mycothiol-dependent enzyme [Acidimicrobiales bacterium]